MPFNPFGLPDRRRISGIGRRTGYLSIPWLVCYLWLTPRALSVRMKADCGSKVEPKMSNIVSQAKEITETYIKYFLYLHLRCLSIPADMPNRFRIYIVSPIWIAAVRLVPLEPLGDGKVMIMSRRNIVRYLIIPRIWRPACVAASASAFSAKAIVNSSTSHG